MANQTFTPAPNIALPGRAQSPNAAHLANPLGSTYASTYGYTTTNLLMAEIQREIIDAAPAQYNALKFFLSKTPLVKNDDEFKFKEKIWGRSAITVFGYNNITGVLTLAGTYATADVMPVAVNDVIYDPLGQPLLVTVVTPNAVINSATITLVPQTGGALPAAIAAGSILGVQGPLIADGQDTFYHFDRLSLVERYNWIELIQRNRRWTRMELQKYENNGTTDYITHDKQLIIDQLRADMFSRFIAGVRGQFSIINAGSTTTPAKQMGGIVPTMINAGAPELNVTLAGLQSAFKTAAFATNYKKEGAQRIIMATDEMLSELSSLYKEDGLRYTPNDKVADLNLSLYKIGSMQFVPISCELFKENSVLPTSYKNKIVVVDEASINPVTMKGYNMVEMGETKSKKEGTREDYKDYWVQACLSMQYTNPVGGFIINVS